MWESILFSSCHSLFQILLLSSVKTSQEFVFTCSSFSISSWISFSASSAISSGINISSSGIIFEFSSLFSPSSSFISPF